VQDEKYLFDAFGNLSHRSDVGTYTYGSGAGTGSAGLINTAFVADANGNQVSGNVRSITWSSYNKPLEVGKK
jgi:hypothetical protein